MLDSRSDLQVLAVVPLQATCVNVNTKRRYIRFRVLLSDRPERVWVNKAFLQFEFELRENDTKPVVVVRFCVLLTDVGGAHLGDLAHLQLREENATVLLP